MKESKLIASLPAESTADREDVRDLLCRIREGSPFEQTEAFVVLERIYKPLLIAQVQRFRGSSALSTLDSEDLLQEASIVLLRAAKRYDLSQEKVTFGLYLKICLRNALISALRHAKARKTPSEGEKRSYRPRTRSDKGLVRKSKLVGSGVEGLDSSDFARELLPDLTRYEREVFRLFYSGYSYAEIAAELGKTKKSVDNALYRIRKKSRDRLTLKSLSENGFENGTE